MNWVGQLAEFAKRLLQLQGRVDKNAEDIKAIRQDLEKLTQFTRQVTYAVQRNKDKQESDHKTLVLELENALLKLENRLLSPSHIIPTESAKEPKQLPSNGHKLDSQQAER